MSLEVTSIPSTFCLFYSLSSQTLEHSEMGEPKDLREGPGSDDNAWQGTDPRLVPSCPGLPSTLQLLRSASNYKSPADDRAP